eukprot:GILI01031979.1.p1 GENE.GILI01031979.1~~GILI01031979.1.p1  ORF type:complete len:269 (+),score=41.77 GILI01031979.1:41-808(+)
MDDDFIEITVVDLTIGDNVQKVHEAPELAVGLEDLIGTAEETSDAPEVPVSKSLIGSMLNPLGWARGGYSNAMSSSTDEESTDSEDEDKDVSHEVGPTAGSLPEPADDSYLTCHAPQPPTASTADPFYTMAATVHLTPRNEETKEQRMEREEKEMIINCASVLAGDTEAEMQPPTSTGDGTLPNDVGVAPTPKGAPANRGFSAVMNELDDLRIRDPAVAQSEALDVSRFPSHVSAETRSDCNEALRLILAQYSKH